MPVVVHLAQRLKIIGIVELGEVASVWLDVIGNGR
jgi:hypothetical protein